MQGGQPLAIAIPAALAVGIGCGLLNGALVSFGGLPPFIATLGMMSVARGAALLFTEGRPVSGFDEGFRWLATGNVGFIPAPVIVMLLVYAVAHIVLTRTTFGRYVYAIGGNEEATRLSGVAVRFHKTAIYCVSGLMSAVAAIVLTARLNSAQPIAGMMYELDAIAATVIGGTSLMGGEGLAGRHARRRADHGRAPQRPQPAWCIFFPPADRDWRGDCGRRPRGHDAETTSSLNHAKPQSRCQELESAILRAIAWCFSVADVL